MSEMYLTPLIMFAALIVTIVLGIPIAFATGVIALVSAYFLWGSGSIFVILTATTATMNNWILLAVPLFTFMAMVLWKTGVVEDLYDTFYKLAGGLRGGLGVATVIVGAIMGAMTGVVAGTVTALGTIALPQMLKYKYDKDMAIGPILSGGTLGQLIPPSTLMIIYGAIAGVSVGGLFAGGVTSGTFLAAIYCAYILIRSYLNKDLCPALPPENRATFKEKLIAMKKVALPIFVIISVLGSLFSGIATPTEASAVGCLGALICALIKRQLRLEYIRGAALETIRVTTMVAWITIGALCFGNVFTAVGGNKMILSVAAMLPFAKWGTLILALVIIFFLGMFLDTVAIVVICAPIFAPLAESMGIDPLWFAILFMVNLQAAYLTPPFGYSLFYLKGVVPPSISIADIYRASLPFIVLQVVGLIILVLVPELSMWLPRMVIK